MLIFRTVHLSSAFFQFHDIFLKKSDTVCELSENFLKIHEYFDRNRAPKFKIVSNLYEDDETDQNDYIQCTKKECETLSEKNVMTKVFFPFVCYERIYCEYYYGFALISI